MMRLDFNLIERFWQHVIAQNQGVLPACYANDLWYSAQEAERWAHYKDAEEYLDEMSLGGTCYDGR